MRCICIGAGDLTVSQIPVKEEDWIVAVDGGYLYCKMLGIVPDLIVGDLDSIGEQEAQEIVHIREAAPDRVVVLPVEKDDTDMLVALRLALEEGCDEFLLYAGCGGRLEHTIANIQCLLFLKENGAKGYLMDGTGMILLAQNETVRFQEGLEGYLSLFALSERAEGVTLEGLKYPLRDALVRNSYPVGISNEFQEGQAASVTVKKGTLLLILSWAQ